MHNRWPGGLVDVHGHDDRASVCAVVFALLLLAGVAEAGPQPADRQASMREHAIALHNRILQRTGPFIRRRDELNALRQAAALSGDTVAIHAVERASAALQHWTVELMDERYVVNAGDCLWNIARRKGENPFLWVKIFEANDSLLANPNLIFPNQMLRLPGPILKQPPAPAFALRPLTPPSTLAPVTVDLEKKIKQEEEPVVKGSDIEIDGLVIDETQTKLGREFYDLFYGQWRPPANARNFSLVVNERPLPRFGTQLSIRVNDTEVFQRFLQPRAELIEDAVATAVAAAQDYLKNYEQIQKDVQGGDMQGSGIY